MYCLTSDRSVTIQLSIISKTPLSPPLSIPLFSLLEKSFPKFVSSFALNCLWVGFPKQLLFHDRAAWLSLTRQRSPVPLPTSRLRFSTPDWLVKKLSVFLNGILKRCNYFCLTLCTFYFAFLISEDNNLLHQNTMNKIIAVKILSTNSYS